MDRITIAYISDVHLGDVPPSEADKRIQLLNQVEADYLIMAGDICNNRYAAYTFDKIHPKVKKVIIVKGNHEYYHNDINYKAMYPPHVVCLEAGKPFVDGPVAFIGATLWTHVPERRMALIESFMPDYAVIQSEDGDELTCEDTNALHEKQKTELLVDCYRYPDKKIVMVTHHSPSYNGLSPKFAGHPANCAFHSDTIELFSDIENIKVWVHGHTHDEIDYSYNGINVLCNPAGYHKELNSFKVKYFEIDA